MAWKQENLIYLKAKSNISLENGEVFIKAGERKGLKKEQVEKILASRNLKSLVSIEK